MKREELYKHYRQHIEEDALDAPEDVWRAISSQLDIDQQNTVNKKEEISEDAIINETWNSIADELDIDDVWNNISQELDKDRFRIPPVVIRRWIAAAAIILIIGVSSIMHFFTLDKADTLQDTSIALVDSSNTAVIKPLTAQKVTNQTNSNFTQPGEVQSEDHSDQITYSPGTDIAKVAEPLSNYESITSENYIDVKTVDNIQLALLENKEISLIVPDNTIPFDQLQLATFQNDNYYLNTYTLNKYPPIDKSEVLAYNKKDSRWTIGVVTAIKNTYLVNQKTREGFESDKLNSTQISFLPDLGLNVKYALNKKFILDANLFVASSTEQGYKEYLHGEYTSRDIHLNYQMAEMAVKHNAKKSLFSSDKIIRRNVAGVYVARLHSAYENRQYTNENITTKYATFDYGLVIGQEFELKSKSPIKITAGLMAKYGIPNIYSGDSNIPSQLNRTHNASVEFRIGIGYRIRTKEGVDHYLGLLK